MYSNLPNLVLAFHGCDEETYKKVLYNHEPLLPSINSYDWLGNGIYFWENGFSRAQDWAKEYCERKNKKYPNEKKRKPAVIGAVIALGHCLNLTDYGSSEVLKTVHKILTYEFKLHGKELPKNKNIKGNSDILLRELNCAVIQRIHQYNSESGNKCYDSVRGVFVEGKPVYPTSGIREKSHVQLCIVNPNCIKGYFSPLEPDNNWGMV